MEVKLFDKVKCKGYYKKAHDGVYIQLDAKNLTADLMNSHSDKVIEEDVDRVEKRYYEHKDGNFSGVIVGFVDLVVTGWLDVIYEDAVDVGVGVIPEKYYIDKTPKDIVKCAIVYYANNLKHYAPIEDIVEIMN